MTDPIQSAKATHCIEQAGAEEASFLITGIVLCELVWVLESAYRSPRETIVKVLEQILKANNFTFMSQMFSGNL